MSKHTPGPWTVEYPPNGHCYIRDTAYRAEIARVSSDNMLAEGSAAANAALIAAAPELLSLLREAQTLALDLHIGRAYISRSYIDKQTDLNARIDAAIAKATGEQS